MAWNSRIVGHDRIDPKAIKPHPLNHHDHPKEQREALDAAVGEIGFIRSVTINKTTGTLLDGHERLAKALEDGEPLIDVEYVELSEEEERVALATMDQIGRMAKVNPEKFKELSADLEVRSEGLLALLDDMKLKAGLVKPIEEEDAPAARVDEAEELRKKWGVEVGQVWQIGNHRLMCGDATSKDDVGKLLAGAKPFMMVTDPPYGVEYDPEWRHRSGIIDSDRTGSVVNDEIIDWTPAYTLFPGSVAYVWHASYFTIEVGSNLKAVGFQVRASIIWRKQQLVIGRGHYHWQHEPAWYCVRKGATAKWQGDRKQSTIWDIPNPLKSGEEETNHGTQKPIECMARPIRNHGNANDHVYDPFVGSGTTLVAAEMLGRRCYAMDVYPPYVAVALQRMKDMGLEPKLD